MIYTVTCKYERPSNTVATVVMNVEADTAYMAREKARVLIAKQRRSIYRWISAEARSAPQDYEVGKLYQTNDGKCVKIATTFVNRKGSTKLVVEDQDNGKVAMPSFIEFMEAIAPRITVEYWTVYPCGNVYRQTRPLGSSSYDFDDLVRLKITKRNGNIIGKEIME